MTEQSPEHAAHIRLPQEAARLEKHIAHFEAEGDADEADEYRARLKFTLERHAHAKLAAELVDKLGLSHEVTEDKITYNDAVNYVSKVLHEKQHAAEGKRFAALSDYQRGHLRVLSVNSGAHVDDARMKAPRDFAQDVIEHLGLTDPAHVAAASDLFGKGN